MKSDDPDLDENKAKQYPMSPHRAPDLFKHGDVNGKPLHPVGLRYSANAVHLPVNEHCIDQGYYCCTWEGCEKCCPISTEKHHAGCQTDVTGFGHEGKCETFPDLPIS